jgi:hypothetical protein
MAIKLWLELTIFQDEARYNSFPASILFKRIDELDSLDLDNIKIIEIIIKRN